MPCLDVEGVFHPTAQSVTSNSLILLLSDYPTSLLIYLLPTEEVQLHSPGLATQGN
jgi:hypothetical protein